MLPGKIQERFSAVCLPCLKQKMTAWKWV